MFNNYIKNPNNRQQRSINLLEILAMIAGSNMHSTKRSGKSYMVNCPAHEDNHASLSVAEAHDGKILMHCFVGCTIREICASLNISVNALFPKNR